MATNIPGRLIPTSLAEFGRARIGSAPEGQLLCESDESYRLLRPRRSCAPKAAAGARNYRARYDADVVRAAPRGVDACVRYDAYSGTAARVAGLRARVRHVSHRQGCSLSRRAARGFGCNRFGSWKARSRICGPRCLSGLMRKRAYWSRSPTNLNPLPARKFQHRFRCQRKPRHRFLRCANGSAHLLRIDSESEPSSLGTSFRAI